MPNILWIHEANLLQALAVKISLSSFNVSYNRLLNYINIQSSGNKYTKKCFKDTKWVIIIRISKKNRQHNGQKKKYKKTNRIYKTYT